MKRLEVFWLWLGQSLVQFSVAYVKNCCSKTNALRTIVASAVCIGYLGLNTPDASGSHMSNE